MLLLFGMDVSDSKDETLLGENGFGGHLSLRPNKSPGAGSESGGGDVGWAQTRARSANPSESGDSTLTSSSPGKVNASRD